LWEGNLAQALRDMLARADADDHRKYVGRDRGGRLLAAMIAERARIE